MTRAVVAIMRQRPDTQVFIRGDRAVDYGRSWPPWVACRKPAWAMSA